MKRKIFGGLILLSCISLHAATYNMRSEAKGVKVQTKEKTDLITWTNKITGYQNFYSANNLVSWTYATDGDESTETKAIGAYAIGSWVQAEITPSESYTGRVVIKMQHKVFDGYKNKAHFQVFCTQTQNSIVDIYKNTSLYSDSNFTGLTFSADVEDCKSFGFLAKDVGTGNPAFKITDIILEQN